MNHFRTAVLTVILAGGTLVSYATAYTVMDWTADKAAQPRVVSERVMSKEADGNLRAVIARPVRVIDLAGASAADASRADARS